MERWVRHSTCRKPEPNPRPRSRPRWESKTNIAHYTYDIVLEDWTLGPKVNGNRLKVKVKVKRMAMTDCVKFRTRFQVVPKSDHPRYRYQAWKPLGCISLCGIPHGEGKRLAGPCVVFVLPHSSWLPRLEPGKRRTGGN